MIRMIGTDSMKQKRNLSFCISRLPVTDKGVKKMTELLRYTPPSSLLEIFSHFPPPLSQLPPPGKQRNVSSTLRFWNPFDWLPVAQRRQ
jgi:hypothetical protein